ncbi:MAG: hypothetical protein HYW78_04355 [Parcubacteria group bacterium]|nr:hypothetical protein [Parcubacteria group bacterium]
MPYKYKVLEVKRNKYKIPEVEFYADGVYIRFVFNDTGKKVIESSRCSYSNNTYIPKKLYSKIVKVAYAIFTKKETKKKKKPKQLTLAIF